MLLECSCGKMYRVRDDAAHPPTRCPACGGTLRPVSGGAPAGAADPRLKDLEARLQALERDLAATRAAVEVKDRELDEAHSSIARLGADLEKAQNAYKEALKKKDEELEEKQRRLAELQGEGTKSRAQAPAQTLALLKAKDEALQEARERIAQLEHDLKEAQDSIARLGADLEKAQNAYKEALKKKDQELEEKQRCLAELEGKAAAAGKGPVSAELQRAQGRIAQLEKIIQDGEQRFRVLQEQAEKAARDYAVQLEARDRAAGELRARIEDLERQVAAAGQGARPAGGGDSVRLGEARYLAADLDKSLASVGAALQALVERVKRLHDSLNRADAAAAPESEPVSEPIPAVSPPEASVEEEVAPMESDASGDEGRDPLAEEAKLEVPPAPEEGADSPLEEEALSVETSPGPLPEESGPEPEPEPDSASEPPPAKKGLFGKLFGKKK
jgi:chromosome segregation ATPase